MPPLKALSCLPSDVQYSRRTPFLPRDIARTTMQTKPGPNSARWTSRAIFLTTLPGSRVARRSICANSTIQHVTGTASLTASTNHPPRTAPPGHYMTHITMRAANAPETIIYHFHPRMFEQPCLPANKPPPPPNSIPAPTGAGPIMPRYATA